MKFGRILRCEVVQFLLCKLYQCYEQGKELYGGYEGNCFFFGYNGYVFKWIDYRNVFFVGNYKDMKYSGYSNKFVNSC